MLQRSILFGCWTGCLTLGLSLILANSSIAGENTTIVTGSQGRSVTSWRNRVWNQDQLQIDRRTEWGNGDQSYTRSLWTGQGDGNYTGAVDHTNRRGNSRSFQVNGQYDRTGQCSYSNSGAIQGNNGNTVTYNNGGSRACDGSGNYTRQQSYTYPDGTIRSLEAEGTWTGDGSTGTATVKGRQNRYRQFSFSR